MVLTTNGDLLRLQCNLRFAATKCLAQCAVSHEHSVIAPRSENGLSLQTYHKEGMELSKHEGDFSEVGSFSILLQC